MRVIVFYDACGAMAIMNAPNIANRTIFTGDNLPIMRGINSESVDLIYLDPPFNSNRNYAAPIGSPAEGAGFKDIWTLDDIKEVQVEKLKGVNYGLYAVIAAARYANGPAMTAYLTVMGIRLLEIHRILKPTGSVYLHCDPTGQPLYQGDYGRRFRRGESNQRNSVGLRHALRGTGFGQKAGEGPRYYSGLRAGLRQPYL